MPEVSKKKFSDKEQEKIIGQFMDDFDLAFTAESRNRIDQVDDLRFAALDQWPKDIQRERANRPMLTLDHIGQSTRKILGNIRQNMPSIKVDPVDGGSDKETADVIEDIIRQIEQSSNARNAYINAATTQVKMGYGVWRVTTVRNQNDMFDQDIVILPVKNPFTYYFDPDAIMPQKEDGRFMIVSETLSRKKFESQFPDVDIPSGIPRQGLGETQVRWYDSDSVRIGEYFVKRKKKRNITQLSNGIVVNTDEISDEDIALYQAQGVTPVKDRDVEVDVIDWYKLTAFKILEHQEWPSRFFPGVPIYGEEENIEGETIIRGIVRAAKDPQRMYNYWNSAAAETIALQPKAPFLVTSDQVKNYKQFWDRANTDNLPYLPYEMDGTAPPPQRLNPPAMQSGLLQQAAISAQDIQQATGVFEAAQQPTSENRSGRAVIALQQEAELGQSLYQDNTAGGIAHTGRIIIDMFPHYYDTQRMIRLRGEDSGTRFVEINKPILTPDGLKIQNDLTRGKYDVRSSVGPSFRTRRIEAAASMVELGRVFPQIMQVAGDLVAKNLDWPGADELAERLKKLLPPGIADDEDLSDEEKAAIQQQQQQQQQVQQQAVQLEFADKQANIDNTIADTATKQAKAVNTFSETEQNDVENAVQMAELAAAAGNQEALNEALGNVITLVRNGNNPTAGIQQV